MTESPLPEASELLDPSDISPTDRTNQSPEAGATGATGAVSATGETGAAEGEPAKKPNQATRLCMMIQAEAGACLFRTPNGEVYLHMPATGDPGVQRPARDFPCPSTDLAERLLLFFLDIADTIPTRESVKQAMDVLKASATHDPQIPVRHVYVRHGWSPDRSKIYLDMCEPDNSRAIEISRRGWKIVDEPDVIFVRPRGVEPLPEPDGKGHKKALEELRTLLRCATEDDWIATLMFLIVALHPSDQRMLLFLGGSAGTGKTTFMRIIRHLLDPTIHTEAVKPTDKLDFYVIGQHNYVYCIDNISGMPAWLTDALCTLATGATSHHRALYTNDRLHSFRYHRPVILTSISSLIWREDLGSRTMTINLGRIDQRICKDELHEAVDKLRPKVLGALCCAAAYALANPVKGAVNHRMQGLVDWFASAAPALGVKTDAIHASLEASAVDLTESHLESSAIVEPLVRMARRYIEGTKLNEWSGSQHWPEPHVITLSTAELYKELDGIATVAEKRNKHWPDGSRALGQRLGEITASIPARGIEIGKVATNRYRGWRIDFSTLAKTRSLPKRKKTDTSELDLNDEDE